jgi:PAS domain S-box-containing protein
MTEPSYKDIVEHSAQGIIIFSDDPLAIHYASRPMEDLTGFSREELVAAGPEALLDLLHPEDRDLFSQRQSLLREDEASKRAQYRMVPRDGSLRWLEVFTVPIDFYGKPAFQTTFLDITRQKEMERELRDKHAQLLQAQAISGVGSWVFDFGEGTVSGTEEAKRIYGLEGDRWTIPEVQAIALPEHRPMLDQAMKELVEKDKPYDVTFEIRQAGTGNPRLVRSVARYDRERNRVHGVIQDITEPKRAEEALRNSEEQLRNVIQQSNDAIYILHEGRFDLVNERFLDITGATHADLASPGFSFWDLVAPESVPLIQERQRMREEGRDVPSVYEFIIRSLDDRTVHVEASVTEIDHRGGKGVLGILRDVTDQKVLEEQLRQAQKMESIGRLSGGVAHDLNNLLSPILGFGEILSEVRCDDEERMEYAGEVVKAASRARDLVRQLLAFSRKQTLSFTAVDLNTILLDFESLLRRTIREDVEIRLRPEPDLPAIEADVQQLEQVVMNLAVNAQDAMPAGGLLTLRTGTAELDEAYAATRPGVTPGRYVMLTITDDGEGMDPGVREKIFEPFFTTKERGKGTGLGLATVYGIVKQHGGNIWVYSEPGGGTTFRCYFPVRDVPAEEPGPSPEQAPQDLEGSETLLVVEDDEMVLGLAKGVLERWGYDILTAESGEACLALLDEREGPVDLLLTDIVLPGMNGRELAEAVTTRHPSVKTLFMSGYTDDVISHHGVLDEGVAFLQKPFSVRELAARVRQTLDRPAPGPSLQES